MSFVDTRNNKRDGKAYLKPFAAVTGGVALPIVRNPSPGSLRDPTLPMGEVKRVPRSELG